MSSRAAYAHVVERLINRARNDPADLTATEEEAATAARPQLREARVPAVAERLQSTLAEDAASRLIIHDDKPIENVPTMTAPELKLIGRCVSFGMKQTINGVSSLFYYTGLVSAVTATAVTLMYVNRYTEADFKAYREREKRASTAGGVHVSHEFPDKDCRAAALILTGAELLAADHRSSERDAEVSRFPYSLSEVLEGAFGAPPRSSTDPRGSVCPAVRMLTGADLQRLAAHHCRSEPENRERSEEVATAATTAAAMTKSPHCAGALTFRTCSDSLGPLPCVTLLRRGLHDVAFGRSPDSVFYSLLQDPSKKLMDMQYLRMFLRRYLVHTSEGNNPEQISLFTYLREVAGCSDLGHERARQLVREEVVDLMKHDRGIAKEKKRLRSREERREATLRDYRAPSSLFADTGFLYLTGLPQGTLLAAATMFFFTFVFACSYVLPVVIAGDGLIQFFFEELNNVFLSALLMWVVTSIAMFLHALVMRVPSLANSPLLIVRGLTSVGSAVYAVLCAVFITHCTTNDYLLNRMRLSDPGDLCSFYEQNMCSGFFVGCGDGSRGDPLCAPCMPVSYPDSSCYSAITDQLQRVMIPLFLFAIVIFLSALHSLFLVLRLFLVARTTSLTAFA
ncbi:hypothetical protein ABB37_09477 [Leptomonas pyrrhocoris]|uniref:Uncharacterized protein n=1 Tax=Leptomonas pyrrhocoris TaxID=157538 RepID=A0A0M9FQC5_LEPPY|nr:hypothetical protein ABB37_09477 [Leptomonas pyrrhocoris]KPA73833.1 hypothetical protein ABB37_09477 [Leptomonas pyrrhocoris]|eukprot:XP_015652272.1 hypothetical protein ABB37_09477 [Leptomonas pyrrhocoris]